MAPWDVLILLDGGYRITEEQGPGRLDFSDPIGPLAYGLVAIGIHTQAEPSLASVTHGTLVFLVVVTLLTWHASRRRLAGPSWIVRS